MTDFSRRTHECVEEYRFSESLVLIAIYCYARDMNHPTIFDTWRSTQRSRFFASFCHTGVR